MLILSAVVVVLCITLLLVVPHTLRKGLAAGMIAPQRAASTYRRLALACILCSIAALLVAIPYGTHHAAIAEMVTVAISVAGLVLGIIRYRSAF
jgi:hypothetical protein